MSIADEAETVPYGRHPVVLGSRRDDDWQNLRVMRMPALCWRVTSADIETTTRSGNEMVDLAARAIAGGMLGFSK